MEYMVLKIIPFHRCEALCELYDFLFDQYKISQTFLNNLYKHSTSIKDKTPKNFDTS
jgi:hypothetical protein